MLLHVRQVDPNADAMLAAITSALGTFPCIFDEADLGSGQGNLCYIAS